MRRFDAATAVLMLPNCWASQRVKAVTVRQQRKEAV